ncbi:MAG: efflux RND transporter periplasmic adaptor subunit [Bryobacteraceae bacterium]
MRSKVVLFSAVGALCIGAAYLLSGKPNSPKPGGANDTHIAKATVGSIDRVMRLTGQTSARNFANITAPMLRGPESGKALILMKLVKPGAFVKKGELIAQIDAQSTQDHVDDVADAIKQAESDIRKRKAEQQVEWETLQQTLRVAKSAMEKARLDAKTTVLLTEIERELLKLNLEEAQARYEQLQKDLTFHKAANDAEIRILELTKERQQRHHDRHALDLVKFTINAPMNGLAVMQQTWRGGEMGQVQEGDQVGPGQSFMKVVNPASMQVDAKANQAESSDLRIGQPVVVRLDAFPALQFNGHIYSVGALAVGGWMQNNYIRNIPVSIQIEGSDPRLIPDLSAAADVLVETAQNVLSIPLAAVREHNGKATVLARNGDGFEERPVKLGIHDTEHVAIVSGLTDGTEVKLN